MKRFVALMVCAVSLQFGQMVGHRGIAMTMHPTTVGRIPVGWARRTMSGLRLTNFMGRFKLALVEVAKGELIS